MAVFDDKSFEVRGAKIPTTLSDRVLEVSTSLGLNKSDVGKQAILELLRRWDTWEASRAIAQMSALKDAESKEFRYYVSSAVYSLAAKKNLTNTELTTAALLLWVDDHEALYEGLIESTGESVDP